MKRVAARSGLDSWLLYLTLATALAPVVVVVITMVGHDYVPVQDFAVFHLRLRDVLGLDTPLVGVYSQYGWNHPGPVAYWMVAPFVWVAGGQAWGMLVGAAVAQGTAITATAVITRRAHSARAALVWVAIAALAYGATGPWVVLEAWNPHIALPFYVLFLATAWCAVNDPGSRLAMVFVTGSIVLQLHVGYVPLVVPVWAWVGWTCAKTVGFRSVTRSTRRRLVVAAVILWAAPILNDILHPPGNAARLVKYFVTGGGGDSTAGPLVALHQLADAIRVPPPWLRGAHAADQVTGAATGSPVPWALLAVGAVLVALWARRSSSASIRHLVDLALLSLAGGMIALSGIRGQVRVYQFYWIDAVVVLLLVATAAAVISSLSARSDLARRAGRAGLAVLAAAAITVSAGRVADLLQPRDSIHRFENVTRELLGEAAAGAPTGTVIVRWVGSPLGGLQAGIIDGLDQRGVDVRVDKGGGFQWGYRREADVGEAEEVWMVSESGYATSYLLTRDGARLVAASTPLDAAREAELAGLQSSIARKLIADGRADLLTTLDSPLAGFSLAGVPSIEESERNRLGELNQAVQATGPCRCAIVAFPASQAPPRESDPVLGKLIPAG